MLKKKPHRFKPYVMTTETPWDRMSQTERINNLHNRVSAIEEIGEVLNNIYSKVRWFIPIAVTAAISSGIVSGKVGAFLHALFTGTVNN